MKAFIAWESPGVGKRAKQPVYERPRGIVYERALPKRRK
jgi:hypothetical protein